jgi:hypothetical protein
VPCSGDEPVGDSGGRCGCASGGALSWPSPHDGALQTGVPPFGSSDACQCSTHRPELGGTSGIHGEQDAGGTRGTAFGSSSQASAFWLPRAIARGSGAYWAPDEEVAAATAGGEGFGASYLTPCAGPCTPASTTASVTVGHAPDAAHIERLKQDKAQMGAAVRKALKKLQSMLPGKPTCPIPGCGCKTTPAFPLDLPFCGPHVAPYPLGGMILGVHCTQLTFGVCVPPAAPSV